MLLKVLVSKPQPAFISFIKSQIFCQHRLTISYSFMGGIGYQVSVLLLFLKISLLNPAIMTFLILQTYPQDLNLIAPSISRNLLFKSASI